MKSATTVVALVLTLLVWASVASAIPFATAQYSIPTPAPDGQASCALIVTAGKDLGALGTLGVMLTTREGEAQIPELGIGGGVQDGCDIFPDLPHATFLGLERSTTVFEFEWTLEVHAHPDADCEAGGTAKGSVEVLLLSTPPVEVVASVLCE